MAESHKACCNSEPVKSIAVPNTGLEADSANNMTTRFRIENMCCPTEEALIRQRLNKETYIHGLAFQLLDRTLIITHEADQEEKINSALREIGFIPTPLEDKSTLPNTHRISTWRIGLLALSGLCAIAAEVIHYTQGENNVAVILLSMVAILSVGIPTYIKGWQALSQFTLNINALMSVAVTGAVAIEQWPEAAMVIFLFTLAEQLETLSLDRARLAIHKLMVLTPDTAEELQDDLSQDDLSQDDLSQDKLSQDNLLQDKKWITKPAKEILIGATIRVKPGDLIPLDGVISKGYSSVNQASITGESIPVEKTLGDKVFAGTLNENGLLEITVQSKANNSTLSKIIHAVEESQGNKAQTQRFVDQFAKIYTPVVFIIALLTATIPPLLFQQAFSDWFYKALVILVIACPCALVISTPVSIISGLAAAARKGILIKGGAFLEAAHRLTDIALDKTGTLTQGKPRIVSIETFNGHNQNQALQLAASLAANSSHPVSQAIHQYFADGNETEGHNQTLRTDETLLSDVKEFKNLTGQGLTGKIGDTTYFLGNLRLLAELNLKDSAIRKRLETLEKAGNTVVFISSTSSIIAIIAVADPVKPNAKKALSALSALHINTTMLTGDNSIAATAIGNQVGITNIQANLLPQQKLDYINQALKDGKIIAMVGDGINDAPAMAKSHIAIAMGAAGSDTALEIADIALMDDDLNKIPALIKLSQKTSTILKQNIALALSIKIIFLGLAFSGNATLWMAVFADMGTSMIVIFNGLRLIRA